MLCISKRTNQFYSKRMKKILGLTITIMFATYGWTIIQQRNNVDDTKDLFKDATWKEYKNGFWNHNITDKKFHDKKDAGYWMGLEKMHRMTSNKGRWQLLT